MKKTVLIISFNQFGYHIDSYMYAKYSDKEKVALHYFCFDSGLEKIFVENIEVKYVQLAKNRTASYLHFLFGLKRYISKNKFDIIFHIDARFALLTRFMNFFHPMILDIRSGDLSNNKLMNRLKNVQITCTSWFYKRVTVISESLANELKINSAKRTIIPLGGELKTFTSKEFENIKMLYIGSLNNRNIEQTIIGFADFKSKYPEVDIRYDIIGFGNIQTESLIRETIDQKKMNPFIRFHGRMSHNKLASFLDDCNLGIVYVPQKRYYDFQPSTKLFEYVLAGMPIIVTATTENKLGLKPGCGLVCQDNPDSFANGLKYFWDNRNLFNSEYIIDQYKNFDWKSIVQNIWMPLILANSVKHD